MVFFWNVRVATGDFSQPCVACLLREIDNEDDDNTVNHFSDANSIFRPKDQMHARQMIDSVWVRARDDATDKGAKRNVYSSYR